MKKWLLIILYSVIGLYLFLTTCEILVIKFMNDYSLLEIAEEIIINRKLSDVTPKFLVLSSLILAGFILFQAVESILSIGLKKNRDSIIRDYEVLCNEQMNLIKKLQKELQEKVS